MTKTVEYQAFGGGPPSVALMILNAWGEIIPKAEVIVFADTGGEKARTYELMPIYEAWAAEHDLEMVTTRAHMESLTERMLNNQGAKGVPAPVFTETGMGRRMCTVRWKIQPNEKWLRAKFGRRTRLVAQIGYTYPKEILRVRDAKYKLTTNRYPLLEKKLTRQNCVEIIQMAGLPVPPWSACKYCPLQPKGAWQQLASVYTEDFQEVIPIDEGLRSHGGPPQWLSSTRRPLAEAYSTVQGHFPLDEAGLIDPELESCDSGHCHT